MDSRRAMWNVGRTVAFLVVFWAVFLFALPLGISVVEIQLGIQRFPPQPGIATALLLVSTFLALWSAMALALPGDGTPLSAAPPKRFVVSGPYAYLRHPFVGAVVGQVIAIGLAFGSVPVLGYAVILFVFWQLVVFPREERALEARFGEAVREYRRHVRGFRPRLTPYRTSAAGDRRGR